MLVNGALGPEETAGAVAFFAGALEALGLGSWVFFLGAAALGFSSSLGSSIISSSSQESLAAV